MNSTNTLATLGRFPSKPFSPWLIWGLAAAFFVTEYFARVAPSVMAPYLMRDFQVGASALGAMSACFYYAYIAMQVPVGILVDRYGLHRLLTIMAFLTAFSCILFALAKNIVLADLARLLFGIAASFAFVGALKLAFIWFPPSRFGLLSGLTQSLGMIGAAVGAPIAYTVSLLGWRNTMLVIAALFIVNAVLIGLIVRDKPKLATLAVKNPALTLGLWQGLKKVLANKESWWNGIYAGLVYAPTAVFAELWGPSFLVRSYNMSMELAAFAVGAIFIGWGVGGPLIGALFDRLGQRRPIMLASALLGFLLLSTVIYVPHLPVPLLFLLLFLYGISNTGVATAYAVASEINPRAIAGTSMAFANMASVMVGACLQPLVGWLLDWRWQGVMLEGVRFYTADDFRLALFQLPLCLLLGFGCAFKIRETFCKPNEH